MADINLSQDVADALILLPKVRGDELAYDFPLRHPTAIIPLLSEDRRQNFLLDIHSSRIKLSKITFQKKRCRQVVILVRLDLDGPGHRNPDGEEISCPHLHVYREGCGDKWATKVPEDRFPDLSDHWKVLQDFMLFISVIEPPEFRRGLFHD